MIKAFLSDRSPKKQQAKEIYRLIQQAGPFTKAELADLTGLKMTTLSRMIDELLAQELIAQTGLAESNGGRPPVLYQVNPASGFLIGIDLSRTRSSVGLFDLAYRPLELAAFEMTKEHTPQRFLSLVTEKISLWLQTHDIPLDRLLGIGVGSVGPLDRQNGTILEPDAFPADGWKHVPLTQLLRETFNVPVMLENGANTAALAEYLSAGMFPHNLLYCVNGAGLRCSVISNGKILLNQTGDVNSFGHMIIAAGGRECQCGNKGCLHRYVSASALVREAAERLRAGRPSRLTASLAEEPDSITIQDILAASRAGDRLAKELLQESAYYFGIGLANMINLVHPKQVIVSGTLVDLADDYYKKTQEIAEQYIYGNLKGKVAISKGLLRSQAAVTGAVMLMFQSFFEKEPTQFPFRSSGSTVPS